MPILMVGLIAFAVYKKVNVYNAFTNGAKGAIQLVVNIFPYIAGIMLAVALFRVSGLADVLVRMISPIFNAFGIPSQVCELILLRPFTGSGSISLLNDVIIKYNPDSYIARCACTIMGSTETIFYVTAVYFAGTKVKNVGYAIGVAIVCSVIGAIVSCLLCKII